MPTKLLARLAHVAEEGGRLGERRLQRNVVVHRLRSKSIVNNEIILIEVVGSKQLNMVLYLLNTKGFSRSRGPLRRAFAAVAR
jgi:hypothetical protein